ncbi:MAG TPA: hypothetical protein VGC20_16920, partial [bacterium]
MAAGTASTLEARLIAYLGSRVGRPVTVDRLVRIAGGVSRETWAFDLLGGDATGGDEGGARRQPLVLRMDTARPFIES